MTPVNLVIGLPMAAALGFAYGMGPCLISCAPFLAPVFLASDGGPRHSWRIILPLSLGRLTAYITLGGTVGSFGYYLKSMAVDTPLHQLIGAAVIMIGFALLWRRRSPSCPQTGGGRQPLHFMPDREAPRSLMPGGLFLMGVAMALSPCAPLGIVLFSAAMSGSSSAGALLGFVFGLGAIVIPAVFYGWGLAYFSSRLREQLQSWRPRMEALSAWMLVLVGLGNLMRG